MTPCHPHIWDYSNPMRRTCVNCEQVQCFGFYPMRWYVRVDTAEQLVSWLCERFLNDAMTRHDVKFEWIDTMLAADGSPGYVFWREDVIQHLAFVPGETMLREAARLLRKEKRETSTDV